MLQLVTGITTILVGTAAFFAWLQTRSSPRETTVTRNSEYFTSYYFIYSVSSGRDRTHFDCISRSHHPST
ncbi:MAG: hypothetical protein MET45_07805 [Nostoc sp. LLA-1]|nr:hypothetical protein [Cyanocohniella sp. LLY]